MRAGTTRLSPRLALPKPVQTPVPMVIGARASAGPLSSPGAMRRTQPAVRVRQGVGELFENVRMVAGAAGACTLTLTITLSKDLAVCARPDETHARPRVAAIGRDLDELLQDDFAGLPDEIVDKIGQYAGVGTSRIYLQVLDLYDLDHLELMASGVMNQLR